MLAESSGAMFAFLSPPLFLSLSFSDTYISIEIFVFREFEKGENTENQKNYPPTRRTAPTKNDRFSCVYVCWCA